LKQIEFHSDDQKAIEVSWDPLASELFEVVHVKDLSGVTLVLPVPLSIDLNITVAGIKRTGTSNTASESNGTMGGFVNVNEKSEC